MSETLTVASTVGLVEDLAQVGRKPRRPKHQFQLRHKPFQIQPFLLAPVLPGDTLERLDLKVTAVTTGIKNPLLGWWLEHLFFFVPLPALENDSGFGEPIDPAVNVGLFRKLMLNPTATLEGGNWWKDGSTAAAVPAFMLPANAKGYSWLEPCVSAIVRSYFRDEDEDDGPYIGDLPAARAKPPGQENWSESLIGDSDVEPVDVLEDGAIVPSDDPLFNAFMSMKDLGVLGEITYDDWLRDQGIRRPKLSVSGAPLPELIRHTRSYKTPANTADAEGNLNSVVIWQVAEDATKKRMFKEPGFVVGVTVARPKIYLSSQTQPAANLLMDRAFSWMPKALSQHPELAVRQFEETDGPLDQAQEWGPYWIDVVDLFVHGDQFVNLPAATADAGLVPLPAAANGLAKLDRLYPTEASIDALFSGTLKEIRQDGIVQLNFLSRLRDLT